MNLTFNAERHEYRMDGKVVPSVTQLLAPLQDFSGIPKSILERKAQLGTAVHVACELDDLGVLDEESLDHRVKPRLAAWRRFKAEKRPKVLENERRLGHELFGYAGTLDRLMEIDGWWWLIDLKTSVGIYPWVGVQLAAYKALLEVNGRTPEKQMYRGALQLREDGTYRLEPFKDDAADWAVFASLLNLHSWRMRHAA